MKDFTDGSITHHILKIAVPMAIGMIAQMAYQLIDLYFVARIGTHATAGVNAAGNAMLIVGAATQMLGVGIVALISQAVGRRDFADANLVFNQSLMFSFLVCLITATTTYLFARHYLQFIAADQETIEAGVTFICWLLPGFSLMFLMTVFASTLSGMGIIKPSFLVHVLTVLINAILAPILISGWVTGVALGVKGAALASTISISIGALLLGILFFCRLDHCVALNRKLLSPQLKQWYRILKIGLPEGGEIAFMFLYVALVYYAIRQFGASAQAGFSIGSKVLQAIMMPAMAVAFSVSPIVGQNFGAENRKRIKETFRKAALLGTVITLSITVIIQFNPRFFVGVFNADTDTTDVAATFLQMVSLSFVTQGLIFTCTGIFRGLGNTLPSLISSNVGLFSFAIPVIWMSAQLNFSIERVWYIYIASSTLQAAFSLWLLKRTLKRQFDPAEAICAGVGGVFR